MEYQKITNLLGNTSHKVPRFITKKWIEVHGQSGGTYNTNKQIRFKTSMRDLMICATAGVLQEAGDADSRARTRSQV